MLKVIFLTEPLKSPSTRFRVLQYIQEFKKLNLDLTIKEIPKEFSSRLRLINSLSSYEIVVLQRKLFQLWTLWLIRNKSKVLIYDFDDAVMFRDSNSPDFHSRSRLRRFKSTLQYADLVISGNEYLKGLSLPFAKKTSVIPTGINTQIYTQKTKFDNLPFLTIGWIGTERNLTYLKELIKPINELYRTTKNFRFKIVCDGFIEGFECPLEEKLWQEEDEIEDIQSFDIGVFPLIDDQWTRGKCALKLLQYMSCGVASVSSNTDVTSNIITDGVNGFLASTISQWSEKIRFLLENDDQRRSIGINGRTSLFGLFDEKTIALKYARLFEDSHHFAEK